MKPRVLVVDDDAALRYMLREALDEADLDVDLASDGQDALDRLQKSRYDLVLSDLRMPRVDGLALLSASRALQPAPRLILMTAHGSERLAVEAMKQGAWDYLRKPFELDELRAVVNRAVETARLRAENERLSGVAALSRSMVFASPAMERLSVLVQRVAPRDVTVLITGESGTGKERVAEALVAASGRASKAFVRFNCAAIAPELAEAELFGHSRGAFTGAVRARPGLIREAEGGTILFDEVGELDLSTQGRLLRVLQEGEVRPVGEERPIKVDVRVLAATHRDLRERASSGAFREDLYWRLNVVELRVPPLRDRREDVPVLARHFLDGFARRFGLPTPRWSEALSQRLMGYDWPGNVRELQHALERLVALSPDGELDLALLPSGAGPVAPATLDLKSRMEATERGFVAEALAATRGNRTEAARQLGISRVTLHEKLRKYGLGAGEGEGE